MHRSWFIFDTNLLWYLFLIVFILPKCARATLVGNLKSTSTIWKQQLMIYCHGRSIIWSGKANRLLSAEFPHRKLPYCSNRVTTVFFIKLKQTIYRYLQIYSWMIFVHREHQKVFRFEVIIIDGILKCRGVINCVTGNFSAISTKFCQISRIFMLNFM